MKTIFLACFLILGLQIAHGQTSPLNVGVVNGAATYLPHPAYPKVPIDACARSGKVSVKILIMKSGRVKRAEAISGNQFFLKSAVNAAARAKFKWMIDAPPIERIGILIYNFPPSKGCQLIHK